ncbi:MAG: EamA family transporter [Nocardioidaceae bacterium]|nr:EamA family transporter [Nocardioidaceae bacterium]
MFVWASAFVAIRGIGDSFSPGSLALGRLIVGSIALTIFALPRARPFPRGKTLGFIVGYGVTWFAIYNIALNAAETHLDAGTTALIINIGPILIAIFAGLFLGEGFPPGLIIGCVIAFSGVALIAIGGQTGKHATVTTAGVLLCLLAAVAYSTGVILQKFVLKSVAPLPATWIGCMVGAVVCLPFGPGLVRDTADASWAHIGWVVYLGLFPTAIAFVLFAYVLKGLNAGLVSATTYIVPAIVTLLSWIILDETPAAIAFVGGALCLLGVAVTRIRRRIVAPAA